MCIVCDMQAVNEMHAEAAENIVKALAAATFDLIEVTKEYRVLMDPAINGAGALDLKAQAVLDRVEAIMRGAGPAPDPAAEIRKTLGALFPDATIEIINASSEEEANEIIRKLAEGKNKRTH